MNIFNISKANARIAELESQLSAATENSAAVEKRATDLQAELKTAQDALTTEKGNILKVQADFKAASDKVTKLETDLKVSQEAQADFDKKVATAASTKAGAIVAEIGHAPLKDDKAENPGTETKPALFGIAKVQAAIKAQLATSAKQ